MSWRVTFLVSLAFLPTNFLLPIKNSCGGQSPNIILIVSDDAGWADFGFQGSKVIPTPHLDSLAARGVKFSSAYAGSVCSPSRSSLMTGLYNSRIGFESNIEDSGMIIGTAPTIGLSPEQATIFSWLQKAGYHTSLIGKWHLGFHRDNVQNGILYRPGNRPNRMGIDHFKGLLGGSRSYWVGQQSGEAKQLREQKLSDARIIQDAVVEGLHKGSYVTDLLGDWSVEVVKEKAKGQSPFFLCCSFTAPHTPMHAKTSDLEEIDAMSNGLAGDRRTYAAMMLAMDRQIGRILQSLRDPNADGDEADSIESNTLVIFVNDNGGDCCDQNPNGCSNGVLKGGKGSSWEGGFRVPMIIAGAGVNPESHGSSFDDPVHIVDFLPTMLTRTGLKEFEQAELDGVDVLPYINGEMNEPPHEVIYLRRGFAQQTSLRMGKWKLYHSQNTGFKLFDLEANISEDLDQDQSAQYPELVAEMKRRVTGFDAEMMRPKWRMDNEQTQFRFRESLRQQSNWSDSKVWSDEQFQTGAATLTAWDGFANTTLIFRPLSKGEFISVNDMKRQSGLPFMINALRFRSREFPITENSEATIMGEPVVLTASLDGKPASLQLNSTSKEIYQAKFEIGIQLQLFSDLQITGDSTDQFYFSGGFKELKPSTNITKTGRSEIVLSGPSELSGDLQILSGVVTVTHAEALGSANVFVRKGGKLISKVTLPSEVLDRISGEGMIEKLGQHE